MKMKSRAVRAPIVLISALALLAGCAGPGARSSAKEDFVEVPNPAYTMSPNAPETILVPRRYVDQGPPRGNQLAREGVQAVRQAVAPRAEGEPAAGNAPRAPEPALHDTEGRPAQLVARFGMVVALDREQVIFNLGRDSGIKPGRILKVYRGGTVVEGLGLAPGQPVATIEVLGFVGTQGAYGIVKQGGPVQKQDLIAVE